jgi:predicted O-methyltransferase YrrM
MSSRSFAVDPKVEEYVDSVNPVESALLGRLREETSKNPQAQMQIGAAQGQFMAMLAKLMGAKRYLELGVFTGYSSLVMATAMPEDGRVVALDISEEFTSVARRYWKEAGVDHKIDLRLAPALESLEKLIADGQSGTFDIAFIDADKVNLPAYFEACLKLVRAGGVILIDNVLWSGRILTANPEDEVNVALRSFNPTLKDRSDIEVLMLPIADGITMVRKR